MTFLERYQNGERMEVYQEIERLGSKAFEKNIFKEVEAILIETFQRVRLNLEVIYETLKEQQYSFRTRYQSNSERPLSKPLKNCKKRLAELDQEVAPFGHVPFSLKLFFKIVGSCDLSWDYDTNPEILWEYADPLQIFALDDILEFIRVEDWKERMQEEITEGDCPSLEISADYYHKDNVSGGPAYAIELTKHPSIDSRVLYEEHETTFINYLRLSFEKGGFLRMDKTPFQKEFAAYFEKVKPKLLKI